MKGFYGARSSKNGPQRLLFSSSSCHIFDALYPYLDICRGIRVVPISECRSQQSHPLAGISLHGQCCRVESLISPPHLKDIFTVRWQTTNDHRGVLSVHGTRTSNKIIYASQSAQRRFDTCGPQFKNVGQRIKNHLRRK